MTKEDLFAMKSKWKDVPLMHKIVSIISIFISLLVVILAILQIFGVWKDAINVYMPLMGVVNLCQAYLQWNTSRKIAYFSIGTATFIFICSIIYFLLSNILLK